MRGGVDAGSSADGAAHGEGVKAAQAFDFQVPVGWPPLQFQRALLLNVVVENDIAGHRGGLLKPAVPGTEVGCRNRHCGSRRWVAGLDIAGQWVAL